MKFSIHSPRLYVEHDLLEGDVCALSRDHVHFLGTVRRQKAGSQVRLFNGRDGEYLAEITNLERRKGEVKLGPCIRAQTKCPDIWLLFAPIKKARNQFIVEKATELGVSKICPVVTARTNMSIKSDKMAAHIIEAAEQTERLDLPDMAPSQDLTSVIAAWDPDRVLIFADEMSAMDGGARGDDTGGEASQLAAEILAALAPPCAVLVGPEGGFTDEERALLRRQDFVRTVCLGPRILRADTAVVALLSIWQAMSGDWGQA